MIFWLGDLNYRFDDLDPDQVKILVDKHDYDKLHTNDQVFFYFISFLSDGFYLYHSLREIFPTFHQGKMTNFFLASQEPIDLWKL